MGGIVPMMSPSPVQNARSLFYAQQDQPIAEMRPGIRARAAKRADAPAMRAATGAPAAAAHPGIRYSLVRVETDGQAVEVLPSELKDGDAVALRVTANQAGLLRVSSAGATVAATTLARMDSFTTPPLTVSGQEITVVFTSSGAGAFPAGFAGATTVTRQTPPGEKATYVVNASPGASSLAFSMSLKRR
jgi:hypothetical protein